MKGLKAVVLLGALLHATTASAVLVTLEPDDFAPGTDVSNAWASYGITLSTVERGFSDWTITSSPVYAGTSPRAVTGTQDFQFGNSTSLWYNINEAAACYDNPVACATNQSIDNIWRVLRIDFDQPTNFVEVFGTFTADPFGIVMLDSAGNIADTCYLGYSDPSCYDIISLTTDWNTGSVSLSRGTADISTVLIGGILGGATLDRINTNVPEPGALALFAVGAVGFLLRRRRATVESLST